MDDPIEDLFREGYLEILRLARTKLAREHTPVSTMTLAHELYLNLRNRQGLKFGTRQEFLAYSSRAMRSLLVDMARERIAQKRSAELLPLTIGGDIPDVGGTPEQLVALDEALERLAGIEPRLVRVAEMRVIVGMELADIASALNLSEPTIKRDWQRVKAYLYEQLEVDQ
jgi:RNA polymerase sigma factor (TIGR02999 family)